MIIIIRKSKAINYYIKQRGLTKDQAEYRWQKTHRQYEELEALFLSIYSATTVTFEEKPRKLKALTMYQWVSFALIFIVPFVLVANSNGERTELFYVVVFILLVSNLSIAATINQKKTEELQNEKAEAMMRNNQEVIDKLRRIQQLERGMYFQKPELLLALHKLKPKEVKINEEETFGYESEGTLATISYRAKQLKIRMAKLLSRNRE
ncbi:hypothetical protein [Candidatus Enterococcus ferrettii]|uniref:hypothetical protein n=1 Tax=Candidatus Enterococcus ferrettii TaxID=2815324 RepID=UPI001A9BA591|nr:hypothetical protein [Enterococcus sp. 665A]MBO1342576.1 hypothetical protein [Enterococcus sp. 665A]